MIHQMRERFALIALALILGLLSSVVQGQQTQARAHAAGPQQPLYSDYKGVRLGMTPDEVRAKLGAPMQKGDDQDFYVISNNETAQIGYDATHKVYAISIDYVGGTGAPDYKAVVGPEIDRRADGSLHKMVRYEQLGFWVSYNRSNGEVPVVTVTIQKMPQ
jgi:hypothetical protein